MLRRGLVGTSKMHGAATLELFHTQTHTRGREHTQGEARVHAHHNSAYSESED